MLITDHPLVSSPFPLVRVDMKSHTVLCPSISAVLPGISLIYDRWDIEMHSEDHYRHKSKSTVASMYDDLYYCHFCYVS